MILSGSPGGLISPGSQALLLMTEDIILVMVSIAEIKHHDKKQFGRKRFICLMFLHHSPLMKEVRTGTHTGQESGGRS